MELIALDGKAGKFVVGDLDGGIVGILVQRR